MKCWYVVLVASAGFVVGLVVLQRLWYIVLLVSYFDLNFADLLEPDGQVGFEQ